MRNLNILVLAVLFALVLTGPGQTQDYSSLLILDGIRLGMSRSRVEEIRGQGKVEELSGERTLLSYPMLGLSPKEVEIVGGRVTRVLGTSLRYCGWSATVGDDARTLVGQLGSPDSMELHAAGNPNNTLLPPKIETWNFYRFQLSVLVAGGQIWLFALREDLDTPVCTVQICDQVTSR